MAYPVNSPKAAPNPADKPTKNGFKIAPAVNITIEKPRGKTIVEDSIKLIKKIPK